MILQKSDLLLSDTVGTSMSIPCVSNPYFHINQSKVVELFQLNQRELQNTNRKQAQQITFQRRQRQNMCMSEKQNYSDFGINTHLPEDSRKYMHDAHIRYSCDLLCVYRYWCNTLHLTEHGYASCGLLISINLLLTKMLLQVIQFMVRTMAQRQMSV